MADEPTGTEGTPAGEPAAAPTEPTGSPEGKTFTQGELDAIVQHRIARERSKTADYDELKAKAAELDKLQAEKLSETEKLQRERDEATQKAADVIRTANERLIHAAILAEAAKKGVKSPELLLGVLAKDGLTIGDDGQVSGVEDAVTAALGSYPELVGGGGGSADLGARGNAPDLMTMEQYEKLAPEEQHKALMDGKISHLL